MGAALASLKQRLRSLLTRDFKRSSKRMLGGEARRSFPGTPRAQHTFFVGRGKSATGLRRGGASERRSLSAAMAAARQVGAEARVVLLPGLHQPASADQLPWELGTAAVNDRRFPITRPIISLSLSLFPL